MFNINNLTAGKKGEKTSKYNNLKGEDNIFNTRESDHPDSSIIHVASMYTANKNFPIIHTAVNYFCFRCLWTTAFEQEIFTTNTHHFTTFLNCQYNVS